MAALVEVKISGIDNVLNLLKSLPPEVVSKRGGPVRQSLRKGAVVIYKQADANLQAQTHNANSKDKILSTGLLKNNLKVTRGKPPPDQKGERYLIRVKRETYKRKGKVVTTQTSGRLLEYGSSQQPAEPWLRPAFESKARQAIDVSTSELVKSIDRIVKKLSKP